MFPNTFEAVVTLRVFKFLWDLSRSLTAPFSTDNTEEYVFRSESSHLRSREVCTIPARIDRDRGKTARLSNPLVFPVRSRERVRDNFLWRIQFWFVDSKLENFRIFGITFVGHVCLFYFFKYQFDIWESTRFISKFFELSVYNKYLNILSIIIYCTNFYNFHSTIGRTRHQSKCLIGVHQLRSAFAFRRGGEIHGAKVVEKMV